MPDCHSETTITQNTNKFVAGGNFYEDEKTGQRKKEANNVFLIPEKRESLPKPINLHKPSPTKKTTGSGKDAAVEFVVTGPRSTSNNSKRTDRECLVTGNKVPVSQALRLDHPYAPVEHVNFDRLELRESEGGE